ncbi:MAG TPA: hypothetical protein VGO58_19135 [Chitinophagaceae bacterium]|jgi:hypothetical protein|nr:hypothetical protein [Chitinophagaceae bacterium]
MRIKNIDGMSAEDLQQEVQEGGRFVFYPYTISLVLVTFKRVSGVYLVRGKDNKMAKALPFTLLSVLFGWWGIPFGPKYTIEAIRTNIKGGRDVTEDVMATVAGHVLFREAEQQKKMHQ